MTACGFGSPEWRHRAGVAVSIALAVAGCGGTETGNPSAGPSSEWRFVVTDTPVSGDEPVRVPDVYLGLGSVVALACDSGSAVVAGPAAVSLAPSPSAPVTVAEVSCCGIVVELEAQSIGPADAEEQASVLVRGNMGDGTPFVLSNDAPQTLTLSPVTPPLVIDAESRWLLSVDVGVWFAGLDFSGAQPGAEGIRIDSESNPDLLAFAEQRLGSAIALRRDLDGDGQVDPEDVPVASPP